MAGTAAVNGETAMTRRATLDSRLRGMTSKADWCTLRSKSPGRFWWRLSITYMKKLYFTIAYNTAPTATPCIEAHTNSGDGILSNLDIKPPHYV